MLLPLGCSKWYLLFAYEFIRVQIELDFRSGGKILRGINCFNSLLIVSPSLPPDLDSLLGCGSGLITVVNEISL